MLVRKLDSLASFTCGMCYLLGLSFVIVFAPNYGDGPNQQLQYVYNQPELMKVWYVIIYLVFGLSLLFLNSSVNYKLKGSIRHAASSIGIIWSGFVIATGLFAINVIGTINPSSVEVSGMQTLELWQLLSLIISSIGGGIEVMGGLWLLLIAFQLNSIQSKAFKVFSAVIGVSGVLTIFPSLSDLTVVFGLGQMIWFFALSYILYRKV